MKVCTIRIQASTFNEDILIIWVPKVHMAVIWDLDIIEMFLICMQSWEGNREMTQGRKMNLLISSIYLEISQVKISRRCISLWATGENDWDRTTSLISRSWELRWQPHEHLAQNNWICQMGPWWSVKIAHPSIWHLHLCGDMNQLP